MTKRSEGESRKRKEPELLHPKGATGTPYEKRRKTYVEKKTGL